MPSYESRISLSKMLIEVEEFDVSITCKFLLDIVFKST